MKFRTKHGNQKRKPDDNGEHLDTDLNSTDPTIITSPFEKEIRFVYNKISQVSVVNKAEKSKEKHLHNVNSPFKLNVQIS